MPDDSKKKDGEGKGHKNKRTSDEHASKIEEQGTPKTEETKHQESRKREGAKNESQGPHNTK